MLESSCLCGANRVTFDGDIVIRMRCHCIDCRKFSGSTNTNNLLLPIAGLQILQGTLKTYTKQAETGNDMTSYFCGDCGSTLYRTSTFSDKAVSVMIGGIEGLQTIEDCKADIELFVRNRPSWMTPIPGAQQEKDAWLPKH
ncbi:Mss4-like protein [Trichoderma barbatum]